MVFMWSEQRTGREALGDEVTGTLEHCERRWWYCLTSFLKKNKKQKPQLFN